MNFRFTGRRNHQSGFTLLELLVVVAIIAILAAVILANLQSARKRANDATIQSDLQAISKSIEVYIAGGEPQAVTDMVSASPCVFEDVADTGSNWMDKLVTADLLREVPTHPAEAASPPIRYRYAATNDTGTLSYKLYGQLTFPSTPAYFMMENGAGKNNVTQAEALQLPAGCTPRSA